jgi:stage V sporulation protein R
MFAMANFKDEAFIRQYLSPKVMRDLKLFSLEDKDDDYMYTISAIHDDTGYKHVRTALADQYDITTVEPDIQVYDVDRWGDRSLTLRHFIHNERLLDEDSAGAVLKHISYLWGFDVKVESVNADGEAISGLSHIHM